MRCPFCSEEIKDDALICSYCYKAVRPTVINGETKDDGPFQGENKHISSKRHHTGHGIASFVIGIASIAYLIFVVIIWRNVADSQMDPIPAVITIAMFCSPQIFGNLLGLYFGIEGKKRNGKVFSTLGIWINGIVMSLPLIYIAMIILVIISVGL